MDLTRVSYISIKRGVSGSNGGVVHKHSMGC